MDMNIDQLSEFQATQNFKQGIWPRKRLMLKDIIELLLEMIAGIGENIGGWKLLHNNNVKGKGKRRNSRGEFN